MCFLIYNNFNIRKEDKRGYIKMNKRRITKKDLFFMILGKIVFYLSLWACGVAFVVWAFLQNTIY